MTLFLFFLSVLLFVYMFNRTKDILFPGCFFNLIWAIVFFLDLFNFSELYEVRVFTYVIILIGFIFINVPMLLFIESKDSFMRYSIIRSNANLTLNRGSVLLIVQFVLLIAMIPLAIKMNSIAENFATRRSIYASNSDFFMTNFERYVYIYFGIFPAITAQALLVFLLYLKNSFVNNFQMYAHLTLAILLIALEVSTNGGRMAVLNVFFYFFLAYGFSKYSDKFFYGADSCKRNNTKKKMYRFFAVVLIVGIWLTTLRSANESNELEYSLRMIARYFTIGPRLLEKALENPGLFGLEDYAFGGITFAGFSEILRVLFSLIGVKFDGFFASAQQYMNFYYEIGPNIQANAFPTMYYYFLRDFGFVGVIIEPFLIGLFFLFVYIRASNKTNILSYTLFFMIINIAVYSACWWPYYRPENIVSCLYILLLAKLSGIEFKRKM